MKRAPLFLGLLASVHGVVACSGGGDDAPGAKADAASASFDAPVLIADDAGARVDGDSRADVAPADAEGPLCAPRGDGGTDLTLTCEQILIATNPMVLAASNQIALDFRSVATPATAQSFYLERMAKMPGAQGTLSCAAGAPIIEGTRLLIPVSVTLDSLDAFDLGSVAYADGCGLNVSMSFQDGNSCVALTFNRTSNGWAASCVSRGLPCPSVCSPP